MKTLTIPTQMRIQKIDLAIKQLLPSLSRRSIRRLIDNGKVCVNGTRVRFASHTVGAGCKINIDLSSVYKKDHNSISPKKTCDILFANENYIVVNKPSGVPSQPLKGKDTLDMTDLALSSFNEKNKNKR